MSISGLGSMYNSSGYTNANSMYNLLENNKTNNTSTKDSSTTSSSPTPEELLNLAEYISSAMDKMGVEANGKITFSQITKYAETLKKEFEDEMKSDFKELEIPPNAQFTITFDDEGKVKVEGNDPNKAKIQKYFDDNPDMVATYKELQLLQDLEGARKNMQVNPAELRTRIQIESMNTWMAASGNSGNSMANFSDGELALYQGLSAMV